MPFIVTAVTAIAGAIGGVLAAGGIGAALIRIGGTLLLSYAAQALMPKPQMTLQARTVTVREPVMPREIVYGRARKGGVIVFRNASGNKDQFLDLVIVLAAHRVKSIGAVYFEGEMAVNAAGVAQGRWAGTRTALMDTWADFDGSAGAEIDVLFEVRETDDNPASNPAWGPWGRLDTHEIEARAVQARAILSTKDASYTPIVTQLRLYADEVT